MFCGKFDDMPVLGKLKSSIHTCCGQTPGQETKASSGSLSAHTKHTFVRNHIMNNAEEIDTALNHSQELHLMQKKEWSIHTFSLSCTGYYFQNTPCHRLHANIHTQTNTECSDGIMTECCSTRVAQRRTAGDGSQLLLLPAFVRFWVHLQGCTVKDNQWCIQMSECFGCHFVFVSLVCHLPSDTHV